MIFDFLNGKETRLQWASYYARYGYRMPVGTQWIQVLVGALPQKMLTLGKWEKRGRKVKYISQAWLLASREELQCLAKANEKNSSIRGESEDKTEDAFS